MKGNLLDTNIALLAVHHSAARSATVREALVRGPNYLSVLSFWEVLKAMKGKLVVGDPRHWWIDTLAQLTAAPLLIRAEHMAAPSFIKIPSIAP